MLAPEQRKAIHALQQKVEHYDKTKLKMNWDMLAQQNRSESKTEDYFHYDEKGTLLGYLAVFPFGKKVECLCLVDPEYRRRGIARHLMTQALSDWQQQAASFLINTPENATDGHAFCRAVGSVYQFSEHQMVCREIPMPCSKEGIRIRPAVSSDQASIQCLDKEGFGLSMEETNHLRPDEVNGTYIVEAAGEVVGKLRVQRQKEESWIYGFVIKKEERGKGIGRAVLTDIVHREVRNGKTVWLDVVTSNEQALSLYKKCGFTVEGAQAYYRYKA